MQTFEISKKHPLSFEFVVDGKVHKETIFVRVDDPNLPSRMERAEEVAKEKMNAVKVEEIDVKSDVDLNSLKTFDDFAALTDEQQHAIREVSRVTEKAMDEAGEIIISELCDALDTDVRPAFKYCKPFDVVGGNYYVFSFLEAVANEIIEQRQAETKELEKTLSKKAYMQSYMNRSARRSQGKGKKK